MSLYSLKEAEYSTKLCKNEQDIKVIHITNKLSIRIKTCRKISKRLTLARQKTQIALSLEICFDLVLVKKILDYKK